MGGDLDTSRSVPYPMCVYAVHYGMVDDMVEHRQSVSCRAKLTAQRGPRTPPLTLSLVACGMLDIRTCTCGRRTFGRAKPKAWPRPCPTARAPWAWRRVAVAMPMAVARAPAWAAV